MKAIDPLAEIGPKISAAMPGWSYIFAVSEHWTRHGDSYLVPDELAAPDFPNGNRGECYIHLNVDEHKKQIRVGGSWPMATNHGPCVTPCDLWEDGRRLSAPHINVGLTRDPAKIGADILRRFIPDYLALYEKCRAQRDRDGEAEARQKAVAVEFATIMGNTTENAHASWFGDKCYGHVDVNHGGDTATLEIRGNVEILKAALAAAVAAGALTKKED